MRDTFVKILYEHAEMTKGDEQAESFAQAIFEHSHLTLMALMMLHLGYLHFLSVPNA